MGIQLGIIIINKCKNILMPEENKKKKMKKINMNSKFFYNEKQRQHLSIQMMF